MFWTGYCYSDYLGSFNILQRCCYNISKTITSGDRSREVKYEQHGKVSQKMRRLSKHTKNMQQRTTHCTWCSKNGYTKSMTANVASMKQISPYLTTDNAQVQIRCIYSCTGFIQSHCAHFRILGIPCRLYILSSIEIAFCVNINQVLSFIGHQVQCVVCYCMFLVCFESLCIFWDTFPCCSTSVNPHLGPIRFVYFYRCIYL